MITGTAEPSAEGAPAASEAAPETTDNATAAAAPEAAKEEPVKAEPPKESDSDRFAKLLAMDRKRRAKIDAEKAEAAKARAEAEAAKKAAEEAAAKANPILEAIKAKDFKKLMAETGMGVEDLVSLIGGEEERPPTVEEIEERASAKAIELLRKEQAEREAKAKEEAEAKAKAEAEARAEKDRQAIAKHQAKIAEFLDKAGEEFAAAKAVEKLYGALGFEDGFVSKAAMDLIVRVHEETDTVLSIQDAVAQIQKHIAPTLNELKGLFATKEPEKKTSNGAVQPTLSNRTTSGVAAVDTSTDDEEPEDMRERIRRAAKRSNPHWGRV